MLSQITLTVDTCPFPSSEEFRAAAAYCRPTGPYKHLHNPLLLLLFPGELCLPCASLLLLILLQITLTIDTCPFPSSKDFSSTLISRNNSSLQQNTALHQMNPVFSCSAEATDCWSTAHHQHLLNPA
jgi:hypothetical protein